MMMRLGMQLLPGTLIIAVVQVGSLVAQYYLDASYHDHWYFFVALYGIAAATLLWMYRRTVAPALAAPPILIAVCVAGVAIGAALGIYINVADPIPTAVLEERRLSFFLDFDLRFVAVKLADVLFQQVSLAVMILTLLSAGVSIVSASFLLLVVFILAHLFLIPFQGETSVLHFVGAFGLAIVAPYLIARSPPRMFGTFAIHFLGYVVGRIVAGAWYS